MEPARKPEACGNIQEIRNAIDEIDLEIIRLVCTEGCICQGDRKIQILTKIGIIARERKELVLQQRKAWAAEKGLDPELV